MFHRACAVLLAGWLTSIAAAQTPRPTSSEESGPDSGTLRQTFEAQWKKGEWDRAEATLVAGYEADSALAHHIATKLLFGASVSARPLAAGVIARHASLQQLADLARRSIPGQFPDERRLFVRAMGSRAIDPETRTQVRDLAASFVNDTDANVAAAAILSLADTGDRSAIDAFIHRLVDVPATSNSASENDRQILACASMGAFESLSGQRPQSISEARGWWNRNRNAPDTPPASTPSPAPDALTGKFGGQTYFITDRFNVFYRVGSSQKPADDGPLSLEAVKSLLQKSTSEAMDAFAPVVGTPHIPTLRLYLCDPVQFNAKAGNASFAGVTRGYEVVIKADVPRSLPTTVWHEYIHVIHNCNFVNQPRWLSEGLAMSFTLSPRGRGNSGTGQDPQQRQLSPQTGAFTDMINWNSGGSGDSKEASRYATAHLCVDYLRFGGFGAPNERLAFLMGQISRRGSARAALESVYGRPLRELDAGLAAWSGAK